MAEQPTRIVVAYAAKYEPSANRKPLPPSKPDYVVKSATPLLQRPVPSVQSEKGK